MRPPRPGVPGGRRIFEPLDREAEEWLANLPGDFDTEIEDVRSLEERFIEAGGRFEDDE